MQRVANYVANEVIIKGLANSKTFQKLAVKADANIQNVHKTSTQHINTVMEEMMKEQQQQSTINHNSASATGSSTNSSIPKRQPPIPPLRGMAGFLSAVMKEIRNDFGGSSNVKVK
jgi:hypothetical protein